MFCENSYLDRAHWSLRRPVEAIWTHSDRDTRARGRAGSLSIGKFKCNGYRPELAETGLSGWRIAVEQRDGPRMSPINSAPKASPDVAFRDDCHVGLALTIANRQSLPKITGWKATTGAGFQSIAGAPVVAWALPLTMDGEAMRGLDKAGALRQRLLQVGQ